MRELFDRLIQEKEAGIDRIIADATQEGLQIDFKRKEFDSNGEFSTVDRQKLAEALSGFANSAGGLLVFGVDARPGPDRIDCAQTAYPIANIRRFPSEAQTEVGRLVQPRLDGVSISAIESERVLGAGYLLIFVERSNRRPHRSEAKNRKTYYKRHGDSFYEMEHYDIEDAFNRTSAPSLQIYTRIRSHFDNYIENDGAFANIVIGLRNVSDEMARYPYLALQPSFGAYVSSQGVGDYSHGLTIKNQDNWSVFTGGSDDVVHPLLDFPVTSLGIKMYKREGHWYIGNIPAIMARPSVKCRYGCERARSENIAITFDPFELGLQP